MTRVVAALAIHPQVRPSVLDERAQAELAELVTLRDIGGGNWSEASDADVVITGWGTPPIDEAVIAAMPRLKAVFHAAGSVRQLVTPAAWDAGIRVITATEANNEPVADYTTAQLVLALKGTHRAVATMRRTGGLPDHGQTPGCDGQTIGLVSFGSVARKVRERLHAYGSDVVVWDPYLDEETARRAGVRTAPELADLFAESIAVSIHTPLIPGVTEGLVTAEHLAAMPRGATLINTSRGAIVDEPALIAVLESRPDLFAILDVTVTEPPTGDSPLWNLPNVQLTGHSAGSTGTERRRLGRLIVEEIGRYVQGRPLQHELDRAKAAQKA